MGSYIGRWVFVVDVTREGGRGMLLGNTKIENFGKPTSLLWRDGSCKGPAIHLSENRHNDLRLYVNFVAFKKYAVAKKRLKTESDIPNAFFM